MVILIHLDLDFCAGSEIGISFHSLRVNIQLSLTIFWRGNLFSSNFGFFVKNQEVIIIIFIIIVRVCLHGGGGYVWYPHVLGQRTS